MPQPTQNFLIHILLLWTTVISIIQIVIVILFFTAGHKGWDCRAGESSKISSTDNRSTTSLVSSQGKMFSFVFKDEGSSIKWDTLLPDETLISAVNKGLSINMDGYYYINLQITRKSDCSLKGTIPVTLVKIQEDTQKTLLEGSITEENTTSILNKAVKCAAGEKLIINIEPFSCVDESEEKTHLDIIFIPVP